MSPLPFEAAFLPVPFENFDQNTKRLRTVLAEEGEDIGVKKELLFRIHKKFGNSRILYCQYKILPGKINVPSKNC